MLNRSAQLRATFDTALRTHPINVHYLLRSWALRISSSTSPQAGRAARWSRSLPLGLFADAPPRSSHRCMDPTENRPNVGKHFASRGRNPFPSQCFFCRKCSRCTSAYGITCSSLAPRMSAKKAPGKNRKDEEERNYELENEMMRRRIQTIREMIGQ